MNPWRLFAAHDIEDDTTAMHEPTNLVDGDACTVIAGTHKGKTGTVRDINRSKTGHVTITVVQVDGVRFKTLARNVRKSNGVSGHA